MILWLHRCYDRGKQGCDVPLLSRLPFSLKHFSEDFNNSLSLYCRVKSLDTVTPSYSYRTYYQMLIEAYVFAGIHRQSPDMRISSDQLTDSLQLSEPLQFVNYIIFLTPFSLYFWGEKKVSRSKPINTTSVNCRLIRSVWRIHDVISNLILGNSSVCGDFICSPHTSHFLQCCSSCSLLLSKPQWVHPASSISTKYLKYFGLNR